MARPRRQVMAKDNDALANANLKDGLIKDQKPEKTITTRTTKLSENKSKTKGPVKKPVSRKKTRSTRKSMANVEEEETRMEVDREIGEEKTKQILKRKNEKRKEAKKERIDAEDEGDTGENDRPTEEESDGEENVPAAKRPSRPKIVEEKPAKSNQTKRKRASPSEAKEAKRQKVVAGTALIRHRHSRGSGKVLTLGQNDVGQLGLGDDVPERKRPSQVQIAETVIDICAGGMHTVCLTEDGKVYTFGCNDEGALGRDTSEEGSEYVPGSVEIDGQVVMISAGDSHSAALTNDGRVFAWGTFRDSLGPMGFLTSKIQTTPHPVLEGTTVSKIASGNDHLAMLTSSGYLYTCGCAEQGQLGRVAECFASRGGRKGLALVLTPGLAAARRYRGKHLLFDDVWTGFHCTFVRAKETGDIYVCGLNNYYQLGSEDIKTRFVLEKSESFSAKKWVQIAGGQHHTLALDDNGAVYALGRKEYGTLGLGEDSSDMVHPTLVSTLRDVKCVDIACGTSTSYAVTSDGSVYAWGMGTNYALGTGEEDDVYLPTKMEGKQLEGQRTIAVSSGGQHAVLLVTSSSSSSSSTAGGSK